MYSKVLRTLVMVGSMVGVLLAIAGSASAAPTVPEPPGLPAFATQSASPPSASTDTLSPLAEPVITCTEQANNVHNSTHDPTQINQVTTIKCTDVIQSVVGYLDLYFYTSTYGWVLDDSKYFDVGPGVSFSPQINEPCETGTYYVVALGSILFPEGYEPNPQSFKVQSNYSTISSC